ncbi:hypothetical protein GGI12_000177 [Dipsacomyces acuminosporus]|nr:hypothetical protein GGI12_000177 [Dipsacomyces acuminosporus]
MFGSIKSVPSVSSFGELSVDRPSSTVCKQDDDDYCRSPSLSNQLSSETLDIQDKKQARRLSRRSVSSVSTGISSIEHDRTPASNATSDSADVCDIYDILDRVHARRLDTQCAAFKPKQLRMLELGDILHKAERINAKRLTNQEYTPPEIRRMQSLQRVASELDDMTESDGRSQQRTLLSPLRAREMFLVSIAGKLGRVDGTTSLTLRNGRSKGAAAGVSAASFLASSRCDEEDDECRSIDSRQRALHPRERMRRFVQRSIERLNRLSAKPMAEQRFLRASASTAAIVPPSPVDTLCPPYPISKH